jgi:hypothetical protein
MSDAFKRLVCRVRGHKRIRRLERIELHGATIDGDPWFRVLEAVEYCDRCKKDPL